MRTNPLWIVFVFLGWYFFLASFAMTPYMLAVGALSGSISSELQFVLDMYLGTIMTVVVLFLLTWRYRDNRYIWKSFLMPKRYEQPVLEPEDAGAEFYGRGRNTVGMLWAGILLGFLTNFVCILCALIHGDIKLYFDASPSQIPFFVFALIAVCVQSTSEELWCRGFLYERLHEKYPLWVSVAVNGILFGLLHIFNPGVTVLSIVSIMICGFSYSLLRWYSGNIWIAMGIHTGWNFTQNFIFGLPNSGLVSEASIFHLDAATGVSNLIYDYGFGVEGALPAVLMDAAVGVICVLLAARSGRLRELGLSRPKTEELYGGK